MVSLVPTKSVTLFISLLLIWIIALGLRRETSFTELKDALSDIYTVADNPSKSSTNKHSPSPSSVSQTDGQKHQQHKPSLDTATKQSNSWDLPTFKTEWLATELGGDFDGSRLEQLCSETKWRRDAVLQMLHSRGGIGNVRGTILDFFYFAVRTGSHVVLPGYVKRTDASLNWMDESNGYHHFNNMFDTQWIMRIMKIHCPQMHIYLTIDDVPYNTTIEDEYNMPSARSDKQAGSHEPRLVAHFDGWLKAQPGYNPNDINLVNFVAAIWNFDLYPQPKLRATFGRLLKISPQIRELAATAVFNMRSHQLPNINPRDQLHRDAYLGVHLRTEADAVMSGWLKNYGDFETQTDIYIKTCKSLGLRVIYVASGSQEDIRKFAEKAEDEAGIEVLSKDDLLPAPKDRIILNSLTWDQHGALDWEILSRSSFFSGPVMSSFSWNLAFRRYFYIEGDERLRKENPYAIQEDDPHATYDDGLSRVIFRTPPGNIIDTSIEEKAPRGMFP
ncbi:hypothetical protein VM1G_08705 [Cytospora mali]|uniref:Alternative oxidase n=1 Tax=Cytospora mali TaxID=578113 RepID=A0A194WA58_CYTMA|nr:hypothetical protein VM1G_08705 [Valsa mali]